MKRSTWVKLYGGECKIKDHVYDFSFTGNVTFKFKFNQLPKLSVELNDFNYTTFLYVKNVFEEQNVNEPLCSHIRASTTFRCSSSSIDE